MSSYYFSMEMYILVKIYISILHCLIFKLSHFSTKIISKNHLFTILLVWCPFYDFFGDCLVACSPPVYLPVTRFFFLDWYPLEHILVKVWDVVEHLFCSIYFNLSNNSNALNTSEYDSPEWSNVLARFMAVSSFSSAHKSATHLAFCKNFTFFS